MEKLEKHLIFKEVTKDGEVSDIGEEVINNISKESERHIIKEYFDDTVNAYYNSKLNTVYIVETKELKDGSMQVLIYNI